MCGLDKRGAFVLVALAFCGRLPANAQDAPDSRQTEYVTWRWPVAVPQSATKGTLSVVNDLRELLNQKGDIGQPSANPGCCLWIEVGTTPVSPYPSGYLIVIGAGGGRILASNETELRKAAKRLASLAQKERDDQIKVPLGIITNFPTNRIIQAQGDERE